MKEQEKSLIQTEQKNGVKITRSLIDYDKIEEMRLERQLSNMDYQMEMEKIWYYIVIAFAVLSYILLWYLGW